MMMSAHIPLVFTSLLVIIHCALSSDQCRVWDPTYAQPDVNCLQTLAELVKAQNKWAYVLHMHKGGGSTLCYFFRLQKKLHVPGEQNCNGDHEMKRLVRGTVTEQLHLLQMTNYSVLFNENPMDNQTLLTDTFFYITTWRDPLEREISKIVYNAGGNATYDEMKHTFKERVEKGGWNFPGYGNFFSLTLTGLSESKTNEAELIRAARAWLDEFALVIPTRYLRQGMSVLNKLFSFKVPTDIAVNDYHLAQTYRNHLVRDVPDLVSRFIHKNAVDYSLYGLIVEKFIDVCRLMNVAL